MKRFNKFLALFLAVVMAVGMLPAGVSAAEGSKVIFEYGFEDIAQLPSGGTGVAYHETNFGGGKHEISEIAHTGSQAVMLLPSSATSSKVNPNDGNKFVDTMGWVTVLLPASNFEALATYKISAWVKADKADSTANFLAQYADYTLFSKPLTTTVGTDWTLVELEFVIPAGLAGTNNIKFRFGSSYYDTNKTTLNGYYLLVDDIRIEKTKDAPDPYKTILEKLAATDIADMTEDVDGTGKDLVLQSGKTLDLAGYTLIVDSLTALKGANVIDSVGGGKLVVAKEALLLQKTNSYLPIKVDGGYTFSNVEKFNHEFRDAATGTLVYAARPSLGAENNETYLANGAADNGLSIVLRLTWTNKSGTITMDVPCSDDDIKTVYSGSDAFVMTVTGVDAVENLKVATVVCSDTGVTVVGESLAYVAN